MTDTKNTVIDELAMRLERALADMPNINHGPLDKGDYSRAVKRLALAIHDTTAALRASIPGGVGVKVKPLEWKDYRSDGTRQAKTPHGGVLWATPNGWGNRHFPEQFKGDGLEANMSAAEANYQATTLSALELSPAETAPLPTRNEEAGFVEFLNYDAPTMVRDIEGRCAILLDLNTRQTIGYRVYDPDLSPAEGQVRLSEELTDIIAALPPSASGKPHLTFYATPSNPVVSDGEEEHRIEDLRFKAFRTNDPDDRQAYFDAVSKWFQDRHYRAISVKPQSGEEE